MVISDTGSQYIFSDKEFKTIRENLQAFLSNFHSVRIEREDAGRGFYVYYPADEPDGSWIQFCHNIDYLDGWLYGVVQGHRRKEFMDKTAILHFDGPIDKETNEPLYEDFVINTQMNRKEINALARQIGKIKKNADEISVPDYDDDNFLVKAPDVDGFVVPSDWNEMSWNTKISMICNYLSATTSKFTIIKSHTGVCQID